jgi:hypothetical protein
LATEARGLTERFGERTAVDQPDCAIPKGPVYGSLALCSPLSDDLLDVPE